MKLLYLKPRASAFAFPRAIHSFCKTETVPKWGTSYKSFLDLRTEIYKREEGNYFSPCQKCEVP